MNIYVLLMRYSESNIHSLK